MLCACLRLGFVALALGAFGARAVGEKELKMGNRTIERVRARPCSFHFPVLAGLGARWRRSSDADARTVYALTDGATAHTLALCAVHRPGPAKSVRDSVLSALRGSMVG